MSAADIPTIVKHMALAIYDSGWGGASPKTPTGGQTTKIMQCLDAARWRLVEYGFLRHGSQHGPPSNITLTPKGKKRDYQHKRESDAKAKNGRFDKLYELIDTEVENPITDTETKDSDVVLGSRESAYKAKQQERRADVAAKVPPPRSSNKIKKARVRRARRRW